MTQTRLLAAALLAATLLAGCVQQPRQAADYAARQDSLFLGYTLGMTRAEFFEHSRALNRQELVIQGPMNQHIQRRLDSALAHEATMLFYPDFYEDKIVYMRVRFSYDAWAPWNKNLNADSLLPDVVRLLTRWYGEGFEERTVIGPYGAPVPEFEREDANRRIVVGVLDDIEVGVLFTDLEAVQAAAQAPAQDADE